MYLVKSPQGIVSLLAWEVWVGVGGKVGNGQHYHRKEETLRVGAFHNSLEEWLEY